MADTGGADRAPEGWRPVGDEGGSLLLALFRQDDVGDLSHGRWF